MVTRPHPSYATEVVCKEANAVAFVGFNEHNNRWTAIGYIGRRSKCHFNYSFSNAQAMKAYVDKFFDEQRGYVEHKKARRADHTLKVGDILYSAWGYECTIVDFYKVVAVTAKTVKLRKLNATREYDNHIGGTSTPTETFVDDEIITKRANADNSVRISDYRGAYPWKGSPIRFSDY